MTKAKAKKTDNGLKNLVDPKNIDPNTVFIARLELRSIGKGDMVVPSIEWSHQFTEHPTQGIPAAYAAMASIYAAIDQQMTSVEGVANEDLPQDRTEAARALLAQVEKNGLAKKTTDN